MSGVFLSIGVSMDQILLIGAVICFLLDAFRIQAAISWTPLAFALITTALFLL